jgi:TolB-like protein/predicted Ser/Thr protein kinase
LTKDSLISGKYRIIEEIGRGGMGVVYKAEDLTLKRPVALKFLPAHLMNSSELKERFVIEAQAAAALSHPNICVIYEVGEAEDRSFIAMEYVEGESLRDKIKRGPLAAEEALDIAAQIATGLGEAHRKGIIHRDIKSANIMVTDKGQAKVMDFGLAKLRGGTSLTKSQTTLGTVAYMSPEQARGDPLDGRTDIWSLGVVLYEMMTCELPFKGEYDQAMIHSILYEKPESLTKARPDAVSGLEQIIGLALAKDPANRYQTMENLSEDLSAIASGLKPLRAKPRPGKGRIFGIRKVYVYAALALAVVLFGFNVGGIRDRLLGRSGAPPRAIKLAVLPFENLTGDPGQEYFSDGLTEEMIAQLGRLDPQRLSVIARTSAMGYKRTAKPIEQIGRELDVAYVLEGSTRREGGRVRITVQLIRVRDQTQHWADTFERELESILALQSEVAQGVAQSLAIALIPTEQARLAKTRVVRPEAYEQYQMGRYRLAERTVAGLEAAVGHFERAIAIDPTYALAYAGLADVHVLLPFFSSDVPPAVGRARAVAAANRALALDSSLGQSQAALGLVSEFEFKWDAAEGHFRRAIALDPGYATAHHWYADMLARRGRKSEALAEIRKALELDPLSAIINQDLGYVLTLAGERDAGIRQYERTLELDPAFSATWIVLAFTLLEAGRFEDASHALSHWAELSGYDPVKFRQLADAAAAHARSGAPQPVPAGIDMAQMVPPYAIPQFYMALGQKERALDALERAYEQGTFSAVSSVLSPLFDSIRTDPRFLAILKKIGLESRDRN